MDKIGAETLKRMEKAAAYNGAIFRQLNPVVSGDILEIGCGIGSFTEQLVRKGNVTAVDIEKVYIARTKRRLGKRAEVGFGDIEHAQYFFPKGRKFNSMICLNVLEHIKDDQKALSNMSSLLKKEGKIFLLTPAMPLFYGQMDRGLGHFRRYTGEGLKRMFEKSGLQVDTVYYFNWLGGLGWFLNSRVLQRKLLPSHQLALFAFVSRPLLFLERFIKPPFGLSVCIIAHK